MKSAILLLALTVVVLSSCTTAYNTGQTPDDVYYSPARPQDEYVQSEKRNDRNYRYSDDYYEDRYLRMKVQNRYRWSDLDDWYGSERRYRYTVYTGYNLYNNPWTPQTYWNSYYNPYYSHCYTTGNIKTTAYTKPRIFNLNTYTSTTTNTRKINSNSFKNTSNTYYETSTRDRNSNSNSGSFLRNIFNGNNSSSGSKVNTSSGNSSGNSSGSSGSSAPVRKF